MQSLAKTALETMVEVCSGWQTVAGSGEAVVRWKGDLRWRICRTGLEESPNTSRQHAA